MAFKLAERVKQKTTTSGTGDISLGSSVTGFQDFADALSDGDTTHYCITNGQYWEVGLGTYDSGLDTISRDTIIASSTGSKLDLPNGTKTIFLTVSGAYINGKADQADLDAHTSDTSNPHSVTKSQVGLSNVDNTADADKPVSTAQQTAIDAKVSIAGTETITGAKTFSSAVTISGTAPALFFTETDQTSPAGAYRIDGSGDQLRVVRSASIKGYWDNNGYNSNNNKISNLASGTASGDAVNKSQLDTKADSSHTHATTDVTSGTFADARISESSVTQHQAALSITESQISDLSHYSSSDFDTDFSGKTADDLTEGATNLFLTGAERTKLGFVTITQDVDLDAIETRVNQLDAAVVIHGCFDASLGSFPGSGCALAGDS